MIRINDNGELVQVTFRSDGAEGTIEYESVIATAAELKAAYAERGMVVISVEDARGALWAIPYGGVECRGDKCREEWCRSCWDEDTVQAAIQKKDALIDRLRTAIKEAP